jgi:ribosome-associated protein
MADVARAMDSKTLALRCRELAENRKAENVVVIDVSDVSTVTDYFVVATGTSDPHLRAIVDEITDKLLEEHGLKPNTEGKPPTPWVVMDYFDVIVHVMRPEVRAQYKLEDLWGDAPQVKKPRARKPKAKAGAV